MYFLVCYINFGVVPVNNKIFFAFEIIMWNTHILTHLRVLYLYVRM